MSFSASWNDGTAVPGHGGPGAQAPPPYSPGGAVPPYPGPGGPPPYDVPQAPPMGAGAQAGGPSGHGDPGRHELAGWGQRALARILDALIVGVPVVIVALILSLAFGGVRSLLGSGDIATSIGIMYGIVTFVLFVAYETVCVRRWRRTVGKYLLRLEVAPLSGAGRQGPIPVLSMMARAVLVNLPYLAGASMGWFVALCLLLVLPCWLWPLWDRPNRQGMQDKLAGTVVVRMD